MGELALNSSQGPRNAACVDCGETCTTDWDRGSGIAFSVDAARNLLRSDPEGSEQMLSALR